MYQTRLLTSQEFSLKNETVAALYNVESDTVRLDDRIKYSPCARAVRKTLIRADALGTLLVDGVFIDIYTLMRIEVGNSILGDKQSSNEAIRTLLCEEGLSTFEGALRIFRFMQAVQWISNPFEKSQITCAQDILDLYARSEYGPTLKGPEFSFRKKRYIYELNNWTKELYMPTGSQEFQTFMQDFCDFINMDTSTPLAQASMAQFQFEVLKPFDEDLDRISRLIMHYILRQRKLLESIILPINLFSAHFKDRFFQLFEPYLNALQDPEDVFDLSPENMILHTSKVAQELLQFTVSLHKMISALVERWRAMLGRVEKGSALELLLYEFAGNPIMTISQASENIKKSFSTTSETFDRLVKAGILRHGKPIRRNKTFEAPEALFLHDGMYKKRAVSFEDFVSK